MKIADLLVWVLLIRTKYYIEFISILKSSFKLDTFKNNLTVLFENSQLCVIKNCTFFCLYALHHKKISIYF